MRLVAAMAPPQSLDAVLLTHHHSDHLVGLADLLLTRWLGGARRHDDRGARRADGPVRGRRARPVGRRHRGADGPRRDHRPPAVDVVAFDAAAGAGGGVAVRRRRRLRHRRAPRAGARRRSPTGSTGRAAPSSSAATPGCARRSSGWRRGADVLVHEVCLRPSPRRSAGTHYGPSPSTTPTPSTWARRRASRGRDRLVLTHFIPLPARRIRAVRGGGPRRRVHRRAGGGRRPHDGGVVSLPTWSTWSSSATARSVRCRRAARPGRAATIVIEPTLDVYHLPRAAHLDAEIMRVLDEIGWATPCPPPAPMLGHGLHHRRRRGARALRRCRAPAGASYMFHQPEPRAGPAGRRRPLPDVDVRLEPRGGGLRAARRPRGGDRPRPRHRAVAGRCGPGTWSAATAPGACVRKQLGIGLRGPAASTSRGWWSTRC